MSDVKTEANSPKLPKSSKALRIALAVSLAVNLAVVGVVAGAMFRDGPGMRGSMVRDLGFGPYTEALTREDRMAMRQALFDRAPEIRETRRMMRDDAQALLALLRAEPFDAAGLVARMDGQHDRMTKQLRLGQDILQEFILAMPPAARLAFADRLEQGLRHNGRDQGREDKKD